MAEYAPYGAWRSPFSPAMVAAHNRRIGELRVSGDDIYWVESRPEEGGRSVLVRSGPDGRQEDVNPAPFNVRSRVHEYGGGSYVIVGDDVVASNFSDQRLYRFAPGAPVRPLTPEGPWRYADAQHDPWRDRLICVREDHSAAGHEPVNSLVSVNLTGAHPGEILASGHDFYASPSLSPDGYRLAWLAWDHPDMPWDGTELWVAELNTDGRLARKWQVAGGPDESIFQPRWSSDGSLYFVSDRTGWWNLYRARAGRVEEVCDLAVEFGRPQWIFGMSTYDFASAQRILAAYTSRGVWHLATLDTLTGELTRIETPFTELGDLHTSPGRLVFLGASPARAESVVVMDLKTHQLSVIQTASDLELDPRYLATPAAVAYPGWAGRTAHGFYYQPHNQDFHGPPGEKPPLLVMIHGGPTSAARTGLRPEIQFWTSRGFGVLDVNYGGSSGYGRPYRERLYGQWGVVDIEDCVQGALYLAAAGEVDGEKLVIRGGSAGGYTTLGALAFRDDFSAGASYYGVSDLEALARETHKFEARYLDRLVGPYPAAIDLYRQRSPLYYADQIRAPLILFQGLDDEVVPPNQSERMAAALRARGVPVAYLSFEGEGHGFRRAETTRRALAAELYFYSRVFGFDLAEPVDPVPIDNL